MRGSASTPDERKRPWTRLHPAKPPISSWVCCRFSLSAIARSACVPMRACTVVSGLSNSVLVGHFVFLLFHPALARHKRGEPGLFASAKGCFFAGTKKSALEASFGRFRIFREARIRRVTRSGKGEGRRAASPQEPSPARHARENRRDRAS